MLLYPALAIGFAFVSVPLLVHLINLLRHKKTKWAAMDFLLASYRKQKRWIVLRQLLLLLTRLAVAALLIAVLAGWIGGKQFVGLLGGQTTHHVVVLDDSYSMQQIVSRDVAVDAESSSDMTAYDRALSAISSLTRRLASDDGEHQLTVMRASRASIIASSQGGTADAAADLSAQSITGDGRQIDRLMSTRASSLRCDITAALDLATELLQATPADVQTLYVLSDFSRRDWAATPRIAESLRGAEQAGVKIRMVDCAGSGSDAVPRNLAITELTPAPDVWVAGVPVVMNVTIKNYGTQSADNVAMATSVIVYSNDTVADPTTTVSGKIQSLPALMVESVPPGGSLTKSFQVYIDQPGTHVVRVSLPEDALAIDNTRHATVPLVDAQRVLIIDGDADQLGAYHVSSVLDPGSQVRIGAIPEIRPVAELRDITFEQLERFRAVYLINVPELTEQTVSILRDYVRGGGGLAWFLGGDVIADNYNAAAWSEVADESLLPFPLDRIDVNADDSSAEPKIESKSNSLVFGAAADNLGPIVSAGNGIFGLVKIRKSWIPAELLRNAESESAEVATNALTYETILARGDGLPIATRHPLGRGRIITVTSGLDGEFNNWPGDPTFVVFLLQTNAILFSGASPPTSRLIDSVAELPLAPQQFLPTVTLLPPAEDPPRLSIELEAQRDQSSIVVSPNELLLSEQSGLDEMLSPGVAEWQRTTTDGRMTLTPMASVLRVDESDLTKVPPAEVIRELAPMEVEFLSAADWTDAGPVAGLSSFLLVLLGLLAVLLAVEQMLAAWASYHPRRSDEAGIARNAFRTEKTMRRTRGESPRSTTGSGALVGSTVSDSRKGR